MTQEEDGRVPPLYDELPPLGEARPAEAGAGLPAGHQAGAKTFRRGARRIDISLSPAGMLGGLLLLGLGFVSVFCLGVVIGRGHEPEAGIPELARMMPEPAQRNAPRIIDGESLMEPGAQNASRPGIIAQADLEYRVHLKDPAQSPKPEAARPASQDQSPKPEAARPASQSQNAESATRTSGDAAASAQEQRSKNPDQQIYHYSYQTASFKDRPSCDSFAAKLTRAGFKTRTEQVQADGKTWYRVMVDFTGKPDDTDALRDKLKTHGVPKALLRVKTPAQ